MDEPARPPFRGFSSPYYTQVPDILFDELLAELSGAELKVLLYIIRRTFGFKKESDNISLSQMVSGITARDGTVFDRGTGLSKETVIRVARSLEERGVICKTRRTGDNQGDEATTYELVMEEGGVRKSDTGGCQKIRHGGVRKSDPQYTVIQEIEYSNNSKDEVLEEKEAGAGESSLVRQSQNPSQYATYAFQEAPEDTVGEVAGKEQRVPSEGFHTAFHETRRRDFAAISNVLDRKLIKVQTHGDEAKETIKAFLSDMAREFNDQAPLKSSLTRAYRLFSEANVSIEAFIGRLFEARSITKERAREGRIRNGSRRMGYFFSVLNERLNLREATGGAV